MENEILLYNLGYNIRLLRKSKKMTIDALAEQAGVSSKYLQGIEVGNRNISVKRLNKIARALETTPESLLTIKSSNLENRDDKLLNTYEKLKKVEPNKLDIISNLIDDINKLSSSENNKKRP
ncbi:helix-turn-helix domain-containing protein [Brachyspira pilosicoli]|uniref:helix-turn-helix domain-containing protein n=1 Tax=Brachyspira pilosicoli TaxID=52584 RepID=UPI001C67276B|nr:helix-turn-helix transcriptional regulator [Brachyspira pilosicoli]MBW5398089.1 XRE family transcriptional regulator [Brachyspira pilosicoli]